MLLTEDFTYKLGDNGVVLNPNSTTLPFVDINKVTGLDNAPYRTTERNHEGSDGSFMDAEFEKGRSVILDGVLYADANDVEPYLDALKYNFAPSRTLVPFYFKKPGVDERLLKVKPLGIKYDVESLRRIGQTNIQFTMHAEDPRIYSSNIKSQMIHVEANANTGRGYNRDYSYGYGAPVESTGGNIVVGGNRPTPVLITIYGAAMQPRIINESAGKDMRFDINLSDGEKLEIDTYYHTVRLNGTANRRSTLIEPNWFSLVPGDNYFRYRSSSGVGNWAQFQFYDAWR